MSLDHFVSTFSALLSFVGLLLVFFQFRNANRQREAESLVKIYDINRELLSLGFDHPQLFAILEDKPGSDPVWERRYLQLWLNQLSLIHVYVKHSVMDDDLRQSLERSLADFMTLKKMREHWQNDRFAYPDSFQKLVDGIIKKCEPPHEAARSGLEAQDLPGNLLKRCAWHAHEGFTAWSGEDGAFVGLRNEPLHEDFVVVSENRCGTGAVVAQRLRFPIFPNDFFNRHMDGVFRFWSMVKQNHAFCFTHEFRGALV